MQHLTWIRRLLPAGLLAFAGTLHAQGVAVPDAGALRQQIEQQRVAPLPPASQPESASTSAETLPSPAFKVEVKGFRFAGNALLDDAQLNSVVAGFLGRPLAFADLQRAADTVAAAYRDAGWIVRVYLPEQDVSDGVVLLQVVEARFGGVVFEGSPSERLMASEVEARFLARQAVGAPLDARGLDRALLLADDLPGVSVAGTLAPGQAEGETALVLQATDEPFVYGNVSVDNAGARSTGAERVVASAYLNSPGGRGELVSLDVLHSTGMDYGRIALEVPSGYNGLRAGLNASFLTYDVVNSPDETNDADIHGRSSSVGLEISYPLVRERQQNLYLAGGFDHKRFFTRDVSQVSSDYQSNAWRLGLSGNHFDGFAGGGVVTASAQLVRGRLTNLQAHGQIDSIDRSYHKLLYGVSRQQNLWPNHWIRLSLSGQHATQVLDSSERFYIGGANSVRAYPTSEHGGDRGQVFTAEWLWQALPDVRITVFTDQGRVVQLAQPSIPRDSLHLRGYGLSVVWQGPGGLSTQATWARRLGDNPRPTLEGTDGDGTLRLNRFWVSANFSF